MLLYWGMFTVGFFFGSILAYVIFASKKPEEEEQPTTFVLINKQNQLEKAEGTFITPLTTHSVKES